MSRRPTSQGKLSQGEANSIHLRELWPYIRHSRIALLIALVCMGLNALATGAYAYLLGPLVRFVFVGTLTPEDSLSRSLAFLGLALETLPIHGVTLVILLVLLAALVKAISQAGRFYFTGMIGEQAGQRLRREMIHSLHRTKPQGAPSLNLGDIANRFTQDVQVFQDAVGVVLSGAVTDSLKILCLLAVALWLDWRMTLFSFVLLPLAILPIAHVARRLRKTSHACREESARVGSQAVEDHHAAGVIRRFGMANERARRFALKNTRLYHAGLRSFAVRAISSPMMELVGALALCSVLLLAGWQKSRGQFVPEHFISVFAAMLLLYEPMKNLGRLQSFYQNGMAGFRRASQLLHRPLLPTDGLRLTWKAPPALHFEEVHLELGGRPILRGVTLSIPAGESLALLGPSGAGKSTLASLLSGENTADSGRVRIGQHEVSQLHPESLVGVLAVVEQRPVLFHESLDYNLRLGLRNINESWFEETLTLCGLNDLVSRLPQGLATPILEDGEGLSEGERQRIALARALLRQPKVLILDEVTSAQDPNTEQWLRQSLERLSGKVTRLVIAHRLSTVKGMDRLAILENGRLVETGKEAELLQNHGLFHQFHQNQTLNRPSKN